jgi:DNA gyrase subunit A
LADEKMEVIQENSPAIVQSSLDSVMNEMFLTYSDYVIKNRAISRSSDGLKPVQRRILVTAKRAGLLSTNSRRKSAFLVGNVLAELHPHGDTSVYDAAVNMAQDFGMRYPLMDGQGNFGSVDGDKAADKRYTEIRLSKIGESMVSSTSKDVVEYQPNYDEKSEEPVELATLFCNGILNGNIGIAVGVATSTLPHYAKDVYKAIDKIIEGSLENKEVTDNDIIKIVKAPDFPLGGIIINPAEVANAYKEGRGRVVVRSHHTIETTKNKQLLVFTDIGYNLNKTNVINSIGKYVLNPDSTIYKDVADVRDESDKSGIRIVVELKKDANVDVALANLFKNTLLQSTVSLNNVMLDDNGKLIENVSLLTMLKKFINYVLKWKFKEYKNTYGKTAARYNVLKGLIKARSNIKEVLDIIMEADDAIAELQKSKFEFTKEQAEAICDTKLSTLNKINIEKYNKECDKCKNECLRLKELLTNKQAFITDIRKVFAEYANSKLFKNDIRRTEINNIGDADFNDKDLIIQDDVIITYSHEGLIKMNKVDEYDTSSRISKGNDANGKQDDFIEKIMSATTKDDLAIFTNIGKCYMLPVYKLPIVSKKSQGKYISNYVELNSEENERIINILPIPSEENDKMLLMLTKRGLAKRLSFDELPKQRSGSKIITFKDDDSLSDVCIVKSGDIIMAAASNGKLLKIQADTIPLTGRMAKGSKCIKLKDDEYAINAIALGSDENDITLFSITENGAAKKFNSSLIKLQRRASAGRNTQRAKANQKQGNIVSVIAVKEDETVFIVTENNIIKRLKVADIKNVANKINYGITAIKLANGDKVKSISAAPSIKEEEKENVEISEVGKDVV